MDFPRMELAGVGVNVVRGRGINGVAGSGVNCVSDVNGIATYYLYGVAKSDVNTRRNQR